MKVQKLAPADAPYARTPDQEAGVFVGNLVDQRHGGPITIGYGRYDPDQTIDEAIAVHDVMVVLEGRISVTSDGATVTAGPGEMIYMPAGTTVSIRSHGEGALTAYVTHPHWQEAR